MQYSVSVSFVTSGFYLFVCCNPKNITTGLLSTMVRSLLLVASVTSSILFLLGNGTEGLLLFPGPRQSSYHHVHATTRTKSNSDLVVMSSRHQRGRPLHMNSVHKDQRRMGELTTPEQSVYDLMREFSESGYTFRIVVVGQGAILETTSPLGPITKLTQSPSTGKRKILFFGATARQ